jgi:hypothetical protein
VCCSVTCCGRLQRNHRALCLSQLQPQTIHGFQCRLCHGRCDGGLAGGSLRPCQSPLQLQELLLAVLLVLQQAAGVCLVGRQAIQ